MKPHFIPKHEANNYRKGTQGRCCRFCAHLKHVCYGGKWQYRCKPIGMLNLKRFNIDRTMVCDQYDGNLMVEKV